MNMDKLTTLSYYPFQFIECLPCLSSYYILFSLVVIPILPKYISLFPFTNEGKVKFGKVNQHAQGSHSKNLSTKFGLTSKPLHFPHTTCLPV